MTYKHFIQINSDPSVFFLLSKRNSLLSGLSKIINSKQYLRNFKFKEFTDEKLTR